MCILRILTVTCFAAAIAACATGPRHPSNPDQRAAPVLKIYGADGGIWSADGRTIVAVPPTLPIRRAELSDVARVSPAFATANAANMTVEVFATVEPPNPLMREDLLAAVRAQLKGIEFVDADGPQVVSVAVERLRYNESRLPEHTQTITYAHHEVNLPRAIVLMPRNASYLYEITTGGVEIEFAFTVKAYQLGHPIADELVRDRLTSAYSTCANVRVQNVSGGVQTAGFIANDDMLKRCAGSGTPTDLDSLRNMVYHQIAEQVAKIAPIARVQEAIAASSCVLPEGRWVVADAPKPSPNTIEAVVLKSGPTSIDVRVTIPDDRPLSLQLRTNGDTRLLGDDGEKLNPSDLKEGQHLFVWLEGCKLDPTLHSPLASVIFACHVDGCPQQGE
jgi:hypothetical protein